METWRLLAAVSVMLVLWAGLLTLMGREIGALDIIFAMVFALFGFYIGDRLSERIGR